MPPGAFAVPLSEAELLLLADALDAHQYWQLGDVLPRNNGEVFIPGDLIPGSDPYWDDAPITEEQAAAIAGVHICRDLADRLRAIAIGPSY